MNLDLLIKMLAACEVLWLSEFIINIHGSHALCELLHAVLKVFNVIAFMTISIITLISLLIMSMLLPRPKFSHLVCHSSL